MEGEGQSDRMASDMEVCMKQRCDTEFLHVEKIVPTDIHQCSETKQYHFLRTWHTDSYPVLGKIQS